jgi:malonate decarboxylase delta subunit
MSTHHLSFSFEARRPVAGRAHVGVVASGDLEVLLEPAADGRAQVLVETSVGGFEDLWRSVLSRFFVQYDGQARLEIHDSGANPGTVMLRLRQAAEIADR